VSPIRALERADLPAVAALHELCVRSGRPIPPRGLDAYFARTLLDCPWADPEIPSLVYTDEDGSVVGFQGSSVRRARFEGQPIRIACAGPLVAHPRVRSRGVGAFLINAYMRGPQDLTIIDGGTEQMREIWLLLGGEMAHLECVGWARILRPWRFAYAHLRGRPDAPAPVRLALGALDGATTRWVGRMAPPPERDLSAEPLTPTTLLEHARAFGEHAALHIDYDEPYLRWLFDEVAAVHPRGTPVARLVRAPRDGRALGWYVYYLLPGGTSYVLALVAADRDVDPVLDHLLHHAWSGGATAVRGRIEPRLLEPLARRRCLMHYAGMALVHSHRREILDAIAAGRSQLTRLDGEWWMGPHVLAFPEGS